MQNRKVKATAALIVSLGLVLGTSPAQAADSSKASRSKVRSSIKFNPNAVPVSADVAAAAIAAALTKESGARYRAGGTGPNAFDCSGLVKWAYEQAGVYLPHGSDNQIVVVKRVSKADLKPGDLVFSGRGKGGIQHVALYIGNGKVIHATYGSASRANQVRIDDLDGSWVMVHKAYGRVVQ